MLNGCGRRGRCGRRPRTPAHRKGRSIRGRLGCRCSGLGSRRRSRRSRRRFLRGLGPVVVRPDLNRAGSCRQDECDRHQGRRA
ncbi:hypothetical protein AKJ09_03131 [Labilithrix luteola]|uniref:Uncharacterized protein n=1 Tax=Labilithrix luteola TaxID=1391654 RepID=A0A0K1PSG8_9BACT|nr:hypothetical protein AKJ09_03131 [Labilithrix luteola]